MKTITVFKKSAVIAILAGAAIGANAATFSLGTPSPGAPLSFNNSLHPAAPGGFSDSYTFTLPVNGGSGYSVIDFPLVLPAFPGFPGASFSTSFTSLTLSTYGVDGLLFTADDQVVSTTTSLGASALSMAFGPSGAGPMYLTVAGIALGSGGLYNGSISVTAPAPVPEPESYAMLLAGLGVMGAIALRRNRRKPD